MTEGRAVDPDFGLTALGGKFHMDWRHEGQTPRDLVRRWAALVGDDEAGLERLRRLDEDTRLLLASPLSDDDIHALWRAAAMFYPFYPVAGEEPARGRVWLTEIESELRPYRREPGVSLLWGRSPTSRVRRSSLSLDVWHHKPGYHWSPCRPTP